jgi:hypothetical protein
MRSLLNGINLILKYIIGGFQGSISRGERNKTDVNNKKQLQADDIIT